jgi:hypothetical protein
VLTDDGREVLSRYRQMQQKTRDSIAADVAELGRRLPVISGRK